MFVAVVGRRERDTLVLSAAGVAEAGSRLRVISVGPCKEDRTAECDRPGPERL